MHNPMKWRKLLLKLVGLLLVIEIVIFVWAKPENPPVEDPMVWHTPQMGEIVRRACYDCHSHETDWPWYSRVAPVSFWIRDHVKEGREHLNFSVSDRGDTDETVEVLEEGKMPLPSYIQMHSEAELSDEEMEILIAGFKHHFDVE